MALRFLPYVFLTFSLLAFNSAFAADVCGPPSGDLICNYKKQNVYGAVRQSGTSGWQQYCRIICSNTSETLPKCTGERCTLSRPANVICESSYSVDSTPRMVICTGMNHEDCLKDAGDRCTERDRNHEFDLLCKNKPLPCPECKCIETGPLIEPIIPSGGDHW